MKRRFLRQRMALAAGAAALLALAACGAKAPPVVAETNTTFYAADGSVTATQRTAYTYGEDGRQLGFVTEQSGMVLVQAEHIYDENGVRTGAVMRDAAGNVTTNTFDAEGRLVAMTYPLVFQNEDGEPETFEASQHYTYDEQGRVLEYTNVTPTGAETDRYTYRGDGTGTMEHLLDGAVQYTEDLTLDGDGNILHRVRGGAAAGDGELVTEKTFTYDRDGNLLSEVWDIMGTPREMTYTYDEYGNQLTYRRAEDGVLVEESVSTVLPLAEALARQAGEA